MPLALQKTLADKISALRRYYAPSQGRGFAFSLYVLNGALSQAIFKTPDVTPSPASWSHPTSTILLENTSKLIKVTVVTQAAAALSYELLMAASTGVLVKTCQDAATVPRLKMFLYCAAWFLASRAVIIWYVLICSIRLIVN
ncbi:hypothetical protein MD484_g8904, partial [Candolleomyces efflorescens]